MEQKSTQTKEVNKIYVIFFVLVSLMSLWSIYHQYDIKQILQTLNQQSEIIEKACTNLSNSANKLPPQPVITEKCPQQNIVTSVNDTNCKDKIATVIAIYKLKESSLGGKDSLEKVITLLIDNNNKFIQSKVLNIKTIIPNAVSLDQLKLNFVQNKINMLTSASSVKENYNGIKQWLSKYVIIKKVSPSGISTNEIKLILDNISKLLDKQDFKAVQILLNTIPAEMKTPLAEWEIELNNLIKLNSEVSSLVDYINSPEFLSL